MGDISEDDKKKITEQEEDQIWVWNERLPPTPQLTITQVFSRQVKDSPDAPAVDAPDGTLTYAELDNYSTRLACHVRSILSDISSDEIVPICFDKSIWLVVSMIAVSKAGMAYTTLDPGNPTERLHACLSTITPRVMLVEDKFKERFSGAEMKLVANVTEICNAVEGETNKGVELPVTLPSDLAYVCFTSGSTGLPKVVQHTQSSAVSNVVHGHGYAANSRVLNFASQAFAASVVTTLKTLCNGGLLVLPPERERMGGIASFITRKQITRTFLTPTLLNLLSPDDVSCLQFLTVGGEAVPQRLIDIWAPRLSLVEAIGMTEGVGIANIVDASGKKCRARQFMTGCAWIVDQDDTNTLAPVGEIGELLFEGPALFQGYRSNPEANAKALITELPAWAKKRGADRPKTLFRTGDLAKYVEDGVVQIVGRADTRVKLHGQRFELGEVEKSMLDVLPAGVTVAAEIVEPVNGTGPMLVAFIHGQSTDFSHEVKQLRNRLSATLPDHMIPRGFVELKDRPLNPSGKLDRKLLRQRASEMQLVDLVKHTGSLDKAAPVTPHEKSMQHLWATVLGLPLDYIGLHDDFFYLGGDSLHCIKLIAEARKENVSLSIESMLENKTLQAMSAAASFDAMDQSSKPESEDRAYKISEIAPSILQEDVEDIALATDWQAWCIAQGLLKSHGWHDYMIFKFAKALDIDKLKDACRQLVDKHALLRTVFVVKARQTFQVILKPEAYPFDFTVKQPGNGQNANEAVDTFIQQDKKRKTQLGDPLVTFTLVKDVTDATHQLVLRISHAQYDALSLDTLWRSLEALYAGKTLEIVPFTKFCEEASLASTNSESYWKEALANSAISEVIAHTRPSVSRPINRTVKATIPLADLKAFGFTSATAVLASWSMVLSKLTDQDSVVFGYLISGRHLPLPGVSNVLGPCMNVLPLRADLSSTTKVSSLLSSVQSNYLKSLQHGHLGHYRIIEKCTNWPRWKRFSTVVNHLSFALFDPPFAEHGGCEFSVYEPEHDKSDLWLQTFAREDKLEIELRYSAEAFLEGWVKAVLDCFITVYQQLPDVLEFQLLGALPEFGGEAPQDVLIDQPQPVVETSRSSPEISKTLEDVILASWESALGPDFKSHPGFTYETPFYEIWGNGTAAAGLASEYSKRGFPVSSEEVLDFPSITEATTHLLAWNKAAA
ncbi:phenyloxazoline synthase mbtb [Stemphylium lycopersici]|uniref:Phenyloxazoline synthase mbtb n=1 Tax=Stemphylium lycopersici TaxID=183478 RepID=A0A364MU73_STELY|nr:phenyloxazoline synthase mbtb [Stemphylium lycopersici]RAR03420.1 phenyloxazoline synthase mbtb [Stemphylium lycopersici]RAR03544.1 phenyloxazoline synthase mbtb [Stemphylium lycopersici]